MSEVGGIDWAGSKRIALVVPGDCQIDDEFWRLLAPHGLPLVSRTTGAGPHMTAAGAAAHTKSLAESSDLEMAADRLRQADPVAAAYVDTSISFIRGPGGDLDIARRIEGFLQVPTITTSTAVVHACQALGVARIGVLSVYVDEVNEAIPRFLGPQGVQVVRLHKTETNQEAGLVSGGLARMGAEEFVSLGRRLDGEDIEAVFIPCTAARTLDAI
jgi:maleate isomerase